MITDLDIRDYQSLARAQIQLGPFTVITGPTGSGKSAVVRAVRLLAFNARGTSYIRHGASSVLSAAGITDGTAEARQDWSAGIERGGRGKDSYYIAPAGGGPVQTYTKLGGQVPEDVSARLRLTELNFAGQFDRPFLLASSAGDVARTLGELTNVTLVFNAGREARRRALRISDQVKVKEQELARLRERAAAFVPLPARIRAAEQAAAALARASQLSDRAGRLRTALGSVMGAQARYEALAAQAGARPLLPGTMQLEGLATWHERLSALLAEHQARSAEEIRALRAVTALRESEGELERELHDTLEQAGVCPACGQDIKQQRS